MKASRDEILADAAALAAAANVLEKWKGGLQSTITVLRDVERQLNDLASK